MKPLMQEQITEVHTPNGLSSWLLSLGLLLALISTLGGRLYFWDVHGFSLLPGITTSFVVASILLFSALALVRFNPRRVKVEPDVFVLGLTLLFFSDWLCRGYNLLQGPSSRGEILLCSAFCFYMVRYAHPRWFEYLPLAVCVLLISCFITEAAGRLLFSDDNATFIYRLALLKSTFPVIPFYGPLWNGGMDVRDFFATGALNVFLLFYPLIKLFPVESIYNFLAAALLFVVLPLSVWVAARLEKLSGAAAAAAAIIALSSGLLWYRWALKYGTLGFVTSASLIPLNLALACRILARDAVLEWWQAALAVISFSLMLCWTPAGLVFLPLIILGTFSIKRLLRKRGVLILTVALVAINLPWIALFWRVSNVSGFTTAEEAPQSATVLSRDFEPASEAAATFKARPGTFSLSKSLKTLREFSISTHPLILLLTFPGILYLRRRSRVPVALTFLWLVLLGCAVSALKPQFEFDRMLIILSICAALPCAALLDRYLQVIRTSAPLSPRSLISCLMGGFLLSAPLSTAALVRNRTVEQYHFASPLLYQMAEAIKREGGTGRVLFSGFVLHELDGGHLAPLTYLTGKPLMASSPMHNQWRYRQIFPAEFIARGDDGIREYLNLYNITAVFAHEREWRDFFNMRPAEYIERWRGGPFKLFQRLDIKPSWFLEGAGEVISQAENEVRLRVESASAVIKFNYLPFLESSACTLAPHHVTSSITFIALSGCTPGETITIRAGNPFKRLLEGKSK